MALSTTEKRLRGELRDLQKNKLDFAQAFQDETDKFIFYFLLKGDYDSDYAGGYYIGKIMLPKNYPENPADFMMLTPSGRFEPDKKICLTNSGYHKESWTPTWTIRNMMIGFYSVFIDDTTHGISHIKDTPTNRKIMASQSIDYNLKYYFDIFTKFDQFVDIHGSVKNLTDISKEKVKLIELTEQVEHIIDVKPIEPVEHIIDVKPIEPVEHIIDVKSSKPLEPLEQIVDVRLIEQNIFDENILKIKKMNIKHFEIKPFKIIYNILTGSCISN